MNIQIENNIISGKDWSKVNVKVITEQKEKQEENESDKQLKSKSHNEIEASNGSTTNQQAQSEEISTDIIETSDYFPRYNSLFNESLSPFNLGLYQTPDNKEDILRSTQYVGIMPLMPIDTTKKTDGVKVKILSRFHISPTEMLNEVLSGMDYYNNPEMLSVHSYSSYEWKNLSQKNEDNSILFGIINGVGTIDIDLYKNNNASDNNTDLGLIDTYGAFEIIDFVNKAKTVCRKNLKRQSKKKEENLYCKVRGKIVIQKQIKYNASKGQNHRMYCSYNSLSEDIKENQIIKYALHLCQKRPIADSLSEDILFCLSTLSGVPLKKVSMGDFIGLKNNGAYRQYKDALLAAKKIISRYGLSYSSAQPDQKHSGNNENTVNQKYSAYSSEQSKEPKVSIISGRIMPHFIDMNLLFEYYCRVLFRKAIDEFNKNNEGIDFELESTKQAKRRVFPEKSDIEGFFMEHYVPDIVITYTQKGKTDKPKVAAVFDAKYSDIEKQTYKQRERTHQILFYMQVLGCKYGGLISPYNSNEFGNECLSDNILINNGSKEGKSPVLFYIPLDKKDSDIYTDRIINALEKISNKISNGIIEQEKNEQLTKDTSDLADILINHEKKIIPKASRPN